MKAIICDLDGTLCDITERRKFVSDKDNQDWKSFSHPFNISRDEANEWCCELVSLYDHICVKILFVSGRMNKPEVDKATIDWIKRHVGIHTTLNENLFMRKDGDYRADTIIKKEIFEEHFRDQYDIMFCIDDRKSVVDMWRGMGLTVLQCAEGNF